MSKKIGILTSGGDCPGMNAVLFGAIRAGINAGYEMYAVRGGYIGLYNKDFFKVDKHFCDLHYKLGGTMIKSARFPEFKDDSIKLVACDNLKKEGIEALIVIGGDGTFKGAKRLTELGINCIGVPGTIDNDISSTDFTVGFDTALNTVCNSIEQIRDTMSSHSRIGVIEVMGNVCPDLTTYAGIITNADLIITCDNLLPEDEIVARLQKLVDEKADNIIVLVSEKILDTQKLTENIEKRVGVTTRLTVLGHTQRGGMPTPMEKFNAIRMGAYAISLIEQNIGGVCVCLRNNKLTYLNILDALAIERDKKLDLIKLHESLR